MKKAKYWWSLLAGCLGTLLVIRGWGASQVARAQAESDQVQVAQAKIQAQGYEFGPAVNKIVLQLSQPVTAVDRGAQLEVTTQGKARQVSALYLADEQGQALPEGQASQWLALDLVVDSWDLGSLFGYNQERLISQWQDKYLIGVGPLQVTTQEGKSAQVRLSDYDALPHLELPDLAGYQFEQVHVDGVTNPLTGQEESQTLHYGAFEPAAAKDQSQAKFPLLIWLHGQAEGGEDPRIALLGNEVTALSRPQVQEIFTATDQPELKGAYVLAVQTPTYWMDEGDGLNGPGAGHSRYTESLMQVIDDYVASHPQIDPHRVHLMGCSNGGYMTLNMALHYPDYFAGLVPQATAYSYYEFQRLDNGHYLIKDPKKRGSIQAYAPTQRVWFDQDKVAALKNQAIWFVHSLDDPTVPANAYVLPIYKDLVDAGGQNIWLSLFQSVQGQDLPNMRYSGHFSWIPFFNQQVQGVQDPEAIRQSPGLSGFEADNASGGGKAQVQVAGQSYQDVFHWLNAQHR